MKRVLGIAVALASSAVVLVFATGASNDGSGYKVRAIFNNAFSVIPGEDVKIAGVKVGKIESLDVTPDEKAAVVLDITRAGFGDWRKDATCTIRPQSLIGEKFVECTPTQPRPVGAQPAPLLPSDPHHDGQHLLPSTQTSRPIDLDLINNILRLPYRERLRIILDELGTGLAGRGEDLNQVIRNANPALAETDKVLRLLARENKVLRDLARDSDASLAPLAAQRGHVADFVAKAGNVAEATAQKRAPFEQNLAKLPAFLRELKPTMTRLGALSDEMSPVLEDLGAQAPAISRLIMQLGPFSKSATPALTSLGDASVVGRKALVEAKPIVSDLRTFGTEVRPLSANLSALLGSFRDTGGIERLMDYVFYQVAAINGFDSYGHYLRAQLLVNICSTYAIANSPTCTANFSKPASRAVAASASDAYRSAPLVREDRILRDGLTVDQVLGHHRNARRHRTGGGSGGGAIALPPALLPADPEPPAAAAPTAPSGQAPAGNTAQPAGSPTSALLDYLLGGGG